MLSEQIMKSTPFSRGIVSVATVVILAVATYNWTISPQTKYLHAAEKFQAVTNTMEKKTRSLKKTVSIKEQKLESLNQEMVEFKAAFFDHAGRVKFFSNLESVAGQTGCNINLLTFSPDRPIVDDELGMGNIMITAKSVDLEYTGKYAQIIRFLKYLSDHPKRVSVSDLEIESPRNGGTTLDCSMNITIYITENKELATDEEE